MQQKNSNIMLSNNNHYIPQVMIRKFGVEKHVTILKKIRNNSTNAILRYEIIAKILPKSILWSNRLMSNEADNKIYTKTIDVILTTFYNKLIAHRHEYHFNLTDDDVGRLFYAFIIISPHRKEILQQIMSGYTKILDYIVDQNSALLSLFVNEGQKQLLIAPKNRYFVLGDIPVMSFGNGCISAIHNIKFGDEIDTNGHEICAFVGDVRLLLPIHPRFAIELRLNSENIRKKQKDNKTQNNSVEITDDSIDSINYLSFKICEDLIIGQKSELTKIKNTAESRNKTDLS